MVGLVTLPCVAQQAKPLRGHLSLPDKSWGVFLELPGFTVNTVETMVDRRRYMMAGNPETHVVVSLTLEEVSQPATASCHDSLEKRAKKPPFKVQDVKFSQAGQADVMEYMVSNLHISKINFDPADAPLFSQVLDSMKIESVHRSSMELLEQASRLYLQHDYHGAIGPYSQALDLEKTKPELQKPLWYVLIDNLGMSYGITGDLEQARATFEYGIAKDPTYPLFYYNLACTYAEMGKADEASQNLKKAFEYKANVITGETMPDPRKDDSFKKLMQNPDFRQLAETLAQSK